MAAPTHTLTGDASPMTRSTIGRGAALSLSASGLLFLVGAFVHPHAPQARNMAEVAYTQTGEIAWWPAHLLLLASYGLFAAFLFSMSRLGELPTAARQVVKYALPIACFGVLAMLLHLVLPVGRESVADSHRGWALWAKDFVELADGVWAGSVAAVAWRLGRAGIAGNTFIGLLGLAGGLGFAVFSVFVPLTGIVVSLQFTRFLLLFIPVAAILIAVWALVAGGSALFQRERG